MKKVFLFIIVFFQVALIFGQENKWGPWNNSDCYSKIQFRAKLVSKQYYNGGSTSSDGCNSEQGYQWKVQVKNNYDKTVWVIFSGGNKSCVEKNINDANGLNLSPDQVGEINLKDWYSNSTTGIFVLIKAMAFLDSKDDDSYKNDPSLQYESCQDGGLCQICRINTSANHCPDVKQSKKVKMNDNGTSKNNSSNSTGSDNGSNYNEMLSQIVNNLKLNLNNVYIKEYDWLHNDINISIEDQYLKILLSRYFENKGPDKILYKISIPTLEQNQLLEIPTYPKGQYMLSFYNSLNNGNVVKNNTQMIYTANHRVELYYNPGNNLANYNELVNLIKELKNANQKSTISNKQNGNVQKTEAVEKVAKKSASKNDYTPSQKKLNSDKVANQDASFDGNWANFLERNLYYPEEIAAKQIQGKVIVSFKVDKVGNVSQVKSVSGPKELFQTAENLISKSNGMWIPARQNNQFVSNYLRQPITFKLDEETITEKQTAKSTRENQFRYGKIPQGIPVTNIFELNQNVKSAIPICGCITTSINGNKVSVTFNAFQKGIFSNGINIIFENGNTAELRISGEVE